jgi:D-lyxose ketol-isomerase
MKLIPGLLAISLIATVTNLAATEPRPPARLRFKNADFYDKDGKFNAEKAKDACIALMKYHGYPVFAGVREKLWVSDYGKGEFTKLGLAAVMFMNNEKDHYMLMDIYLLPGQMLPEHWHLATDKNPQKIEGWLVRHGLSHIVGEGEPNLGPDVVVPQCHDGGNVTVKHEVIAKPGQFVALNRVEAHHWQLAGPEGVIMSEVANVHDNSGVRHLDKACNDNFLGK